jgi:L-ascorbate metabolism protein UlaG (beta-lactamase superfamily)
MHWGTFPVLAQETETFVALLAETASGCRPVPMKIGQTIPLVRRACAA